MKTLLIDKSGNRWIFDCRDGNMRYSKNGEKEQILLNNMRDDFDIITDHDGNFRLIIQDNSGNLLCLIYDFKNWKKYVILKSRSDANKMTSFKLFSEKIKTHCFYILALNGKTMLVHHVIDGDKSAPEVIAYTYPSKDFACCMDIWGCIHIFYFDEKGVLTYKVCKGKGYEDSILNTDEEIKSICAIFEEKLHIAYTAKMKSYHTLTYYTPNCEKKIISFSESGYSHVNIFSKGSKVFIQWHEKSGWYQCTSDDGGASFKKPVSISHPKSKHIEPVCIRSKANPMVLGADRCVALIGNGTVDILNAQQCIGTPAYENKSNTNHKQKETDYNIIDGEIFDKMKMMQAKIRENEKELIRLNTIIHTLSDKIGSLSKPAQKTANTKPEPLNKENIGEINKENYELFKNTNIDSIEFDGTKQFGKE